MPHSSTRILVFSRTTGFRHESIPDGIRAFAELGAEHHFAVTATEDPAEFTAGLAAGCAAVVFLSTSGTVLTPEGHEALKRYCAAGGGFVGVHGAACTEYEWPFYGELLGAWFRRHPEFQPGEVVIEDHDHPATAHLGKVWRVTDEWYDFRANPRGRVNVLASVDETSYRGGEMGEDHPVAWYHEHAGARVFYTSLGHASEAYSDPDFRAHLLGGLRYAAGIS